MTNDSAMINESAHSSSDSARLKSADLLQKEWRDTSQVTGNGMSQVSEQQTSKAHLPCLELYDSKGQFENKAALSQTAGSERNGLLPPTGIVQAIPPEERPNTDIRSDARNALLPPTGFVQATPREDRPNTDNQSDAGNALLPPTGIVQAAPREDRPTASH